VLITLACGEAPAIEMFTYFGDGSRIGLPSLEVPIEAYPGIPLRSDRLRARRRALRMGPAAVTPAVPRGGPSQTITIRAMPEGVEAPMASPKPLSGKQGKPTASPTVEAIPVAPAPEEVAPPSDP
jgi:hypothetical protein